MKQIDRRALLYDFYGELLTDHQKEIYECVVYEDLSLSEIAADAGISRQGVHHLLKRCDRILEEYEQKLHLIERFQTAKTSIDEIRRIAEASADTTKDASYTKILQLIQQIQEVL